MSDTKFQGDCQHIYQQWDEYARTGNIEGLLSLYAEDAILETPLIPVILDVKRGVLQGHKELQHFFEEGTRRRPNELVRWYRDGTFFCNGKTLIWEYPRQTPNGEQVDILEVMDITNGKITHHRIYWGWFGFDMLQKSLNTPARE